MPPIHRRISALGWFIIVTVLIWASMVMTQIAAGSDLPPVDVPVEVHRDVRHFLRTLGEPDRQYEIVVSRQMLFPSDPRIVAWTGRRDDTCLLNFDLTSYQRRSSIAHEVCHCVYDWQRMGPTAYVAGISLQEVRWREAAAVGCERWLTDDTIEGRVARRKKAVVAAKEVATWR